MSSRGAAAILGSVFLTVSWIAVLAEEVPRLLPDETIERALTAGEVHVYDVPASSGRRLVTVEQFGIDVVVRAATDGGTGFEVDAPSYRQGTESLLVPAGWEALRIEIRSASDAVGPGRYAIALHVLGDGSEEDRRRLAAEAAMTEAARSSALATAEARRQAVASYEQALELWRRLGDREREASVLLRLGVLNRRLGDSSRALELYELALPLLRDQQRTEAVAAVLSDMGLTHWKLGDNDRAQALLDAALALQRQLGNRYGEAITLNNVCLRYHAAGELRPALDCYQRARGLLRELGELQFESVLLTNLGGVYDNLGEPQPALDHYRRALALKRSTGDRQGEARTLNNIAVVYRRTGEMQQALAHYDLALEILRDLGNVGLQASTLRNVGFAYYSLGEPRRALTFLRESLRLLRERGDVRGESITLDVLGRVHASQGEISEAIELHRRALALRRSVGDRKGEVTALNLLGQSLVEAGDPMAALEPFDQALELLEAIDDRRETGNSLYGRGEAYLRLAEAEKAAGSLDRALQLWRETSDPRGEAQTLYALARAERRLGRRDRARQHAEAAVEVIESQRLRVSAPDLRATFLASQHGVYELLVDLLMELHGEQPAAGFEQTALEVSERARARSLVDLLAAAGADVGRGIDPELRRRQAELLRRLNAKADRRSALLSRGQARQEAELELYSVVAELDVVEAEIRRRSSGDKSLDGTTAGDRLPVRFAEIQGQLDRETMLLEYSLGEERSFLWAITASSSAVFQLPGREAIESAAREVARQARTLDPRAASSEKAAAQRLGRWLLGPVADRLDGRRLVVVADGALHYVPFGVLPVPPAEGAAGAAAEPLLAGHEVVYLPSASALAIRRRSAAEDSRDSRGILVLADPVFDASDPRLTALAAPARAAAGPPAAEALTRTPAHRSAQPDSGEAPWAALHRLPATRAEAAAIAAVAPPGETRIAAGFDASRSLVLGEEPGRYRIVHFATHGLIDAGNPELSGLVLSLFDARGEAQDGFVRLRDVYNLDLAADLVVLSGCRTALGREVRGEGLVGLTRGFMYAGVPRVVASLWPVEDRVTAELMGTFYRAMLADGLPPAAALRQAQLSIWRQRKWRDPYYWGAFVLEGDWR